MIRRLLLLCALVSYMILSAISIQAQTCGFDIGLQKRLLSDPVLKSRVDNFEKRWQEQQESLINTASRILVTGSDTTYEIPLVFHIMHNGQTVGSTFNPSSTYIDSLVDYLNKVFSATWSAYASSSGGGTNIPIRFVLAKRDSACNATTGITRTNMFTVPGLPFGNWINYGVNPNATSGSGVSDTFLKSIIQWDPRYYYNIWLVPKINGWDGTSGSGLYGYSEFPGGARYLDGIIMLTSMTSPSGQPNLPHELGHTFNLYHTFWGDCDLGNCSTTGDYVCDTDPHVFTGNSCDNGTNPCTNNPWFDLSHNIMNYSNCRDRFTALQGERAKLGLLYWRGWLIHSLGGTAPGAQTTYTLPVALSGCSGISTANPNHELFIGPNVIKIADLESYSGTFPIDDKAVYVDHTSPTCKRAAIAPAHMSAGGTYNVLVGTGDSAENVRIYIDYNNNGTFETASETAFASDGISTDRNRDHTGTINVPSTGVVFNTPLRVRVISDYYGNNSIVPCGGTLLYGQAEDFTAVISNANLPVIISKIYAQVAADNHSIDVLWNVENEKGISYYEIERSTDGRSFVKVGVQNAMGDYSRYFFNDATPQKGQYNFYRLKIIGSDQSISFSKMISVGINEQQTGVNIYPNPANELLHISVPVSDAYELVITNALGKSVYTRQRLLIRSGKPAVISLKDLGFTAGMYYVKLINVNGLSFISKFIKQ